MNNFSHSADNSSGELSASNLSRLILFALKSTWGEPTIRVIIAAGILVEIPRFVHLPQNSYWGSLLLTILQRIVFPIIINIGAVNVASNLFNGKPITLQELLRAIKTCMIRVTLLYLLAFGLAVPIALYAFFITFNEPFQYNFFIKATLLAELPLSITNPFWFFIIGGIVINNFGVVESMKNAWKIYVSHFGKLAIMGLLVYSILPVFKITFGAIVTLFLSNFDLSALKSLNFINPGLSLQNTVFYNLPTALFQTSWLVFSNVIFIFVYRFLLVKPGQILKKRDNSPLPQSIHPITRQNSKG